MRPAWFPCADIAAHGEHIHTDYGYSYRCPGKTDDGPRRCTCDYGADWPEGVGHRAYCDLYGGAR